MCTKLETLNPNHTTKERIRDNGNRSHDHRVCYVHHRIYFLLQWTQQLILHAVPYSTMESTAVVQDVRGIQRHKHRHARQPSYRTPALSTDRLAVTLTKTQRERAEVTDVPGNFNASAFASCNKHAIWTEFRPTLENEKHKSTTVRRIIRLSRRFWTGVEKAEGRDGRGGAYDKKKSTAYI